MCDMNRLYCNLYNCCPTGPVNTSNAALVTGMLPTSLVGASNPDKQPTLKQLLSELTEVTDWYHLGIFLDIETAELDTIQNNHPCNDQRQKTEMLKVWLHGNNASWKELCAALKMLNMNTVATHIMDKYCKDVLVTSGGNV